MRYLLLAHLDGTEMAKQSKAEWAQLDKDSLGYDEELKRSGRFIASAALQDAREAVIVRRVGNDIAATDGPFVEAKEHLGGFIFVEARDLNEAIAIAAKIPVGKFGAIEVRPEFVIDPDAH